VLWQGGLGGDGCAVLVCVECTSTSTCRYVGSLGHAVMQILWDVVFWVAVWNG